MHIFRVMIDDDLKKGEGMRNFENKNFEFRKDEDGIQPGDTLKLEEYVVGNYPPLSSHYTGRMIERTVKYVFRDAASYGLPEGYCVIGF